MSDPCLKAVFVFFLFVVSFRTIAACDSLTIDSILIEGREKTKTWVILQEARISKGDKIPESHMEERIEEIKTDILRTGLFARVGVTQRQIPDKPCSISILIKLDENWLLMAVPIFDISDKNLNVWWNTYDHDWSRVNYGLKIYHYNFTGRKDRLKLKYHTGFTDKHELSYEYPYISKKHNVGLWMGALYTTQREVNLMTRNNEQVFYRDEGKILQYRTEVFAQIRHRPTRIWSFVATAAWLRYNVHASVAEQNPNFLLYGETKRDFFRMAFQTIKSSLDLTVRPASGLRLGGSIQYTGSVGNNDVSILQTNQELLMAWRLSPKLRLVADLNSGFSFSSQRIPYLFSRIQGYQYDIEGYEYYVLDGNGFLNTGAGLFFQAFKLHVNLFKILGPEPRLKIHLLGDFKINAHAAYINDPWQENENTLTNTALGSITAGFDLVVNQALKLQLNYSVNHLRQTGFFIHTKSAFR